MFFFFFCFVSDVLGATGDIWGMLRLFSGEKLKEGEECAGADGCALLTMPGDPILDSRSCFSP